jgi:hypothetical protein
MTTKRHRPIAAGVSDAERERDVQREVDTFLRALSSYPEHFARKPYLSFQQHLFSLTTYRHTCDQGTDRRRNS